MRNDFVSFFSGFFSGKESGKKHKCLAVAAAMSGGEITFMNSIYSVAIYCFFWGGKVVGGGFLVVLAVVAAVFISNFRCGTLTTYIVCNCKKNKRNCPFAIFSVDPKVVSWNSHIKKTKKLTTSLRC